MDIESLRILNKIDENITVNSFDFFLFDRALSKCCFINTWEGILTSPLVERRITSSDNSGVLCDGNVSVLLYAVVNKVLFDTELYTAGGMVGGTLPLGGCPSEGLGSEVVFHTLMVRDLNWSECALWSEPQMP